MCGPRGFFFAAWRTRIASRQGRRLAALPVLLLALVGAAVHAAAAWAAFPGENGRIAFSRQISPRTTAIYSMASDGGDVRRLTTAGGFHWSPAWSPDGTRLAFASNRDGDFHIYVINADGSDQRRVTDDPADEMDPTWSPDGTRLAYSSRRELFAIGVDGRAERQLTAFGQLPFWPSWAPDGSEIAFTLGRSLAAVPPAGAGTARRIGRGGPRLQLTPDWSPDATRLAFGGEGLRMWSIGRDGTGLSPVSRTITGYQAAWSPDGQRMVFVSNQDARLHAMDAAGGGEIALRGSQAADSQPSWQPKPAATSSPTPGPAARGSGDTDGDRVSVAQGDCDDGDAAVNPGAREVPGNAIDENCDDRREPWPVVEARVIIKVQRERQNRRANLVGMRVRDLRRGETIVVSCAGRCSRNLRVRRTVSRPTSLLRLDRAIAGAWVAVGGSLVASVQRPGYATRTESFRMRASGRTPWVARRTCRLPGGGPDRDCDGFVDPPLVRATASLRTAARGRRTQIRSLSVDGLPAGVVALSCRGDGCTPEMTDATTMEFPAVGVRLDSFRGARLSPGARLQLTIFRRGFVARVYRWTIRAHGAPRQQLLCQQPEERRPGSCLPE